MPGQEQDRVRNRARIFCNLKKRGEWVELKVKTRAAELGLAFPGDRTKNLYLGNRAAGIYSRRPRKLTLLRPCSHRIPNWGSS